MFLNLHIHLPLSLKLLSFREERFCLLTDLVFKASAFIVCKVAEPWTMITDQMMAGHADVQLRRLAQTCRKLQKGRHSNTPMEPAGYHALQVLVCCTFACHVSPNGLNWSAIPRAVSDYSSSPLNFFVSKSSVSMVQAIVHCQ